MRKLLLISMVLFWFTQTTYCQEANDTICETYFDTVVCDPYQWLEDLNSERTKAWLKQQKKKTNKYSRKLIDQNSIYDKLREYSYITYKPVIREGDYYFSFRPTATGEPAHLYIRDQYKGVEKFLINPNKFRKNRSDIVSISDLKVSRDNKYIALSLSHNGRDWRTIHVMKIEGKKLLNDKIEHVKFGKLQWYADGFFYLKYKQKNDLNSLKTINKNPQLFYHKLGKEQSEDKLIYELPERKATNHFSFKVSGNEKYLFINSYNIGDDEKLQKTVSYLNLDSINKKKPKAFIAVKASAKCYFTVIDEKNDKVLVKSDYKNEKSGIYEYDLFKMNAYKVLVKPQPEVLKTVVYANNKLLCKYFDEGKNSLIIYNVNGKGLMRYNYPEGYYVGHFEAEQKDMEVYFYVKSFVSPPKVYKLDLNTLKIEITEKTKVNFNSSKYKTEYVKYLSKDSTEIPMYLTYKKGLKKTGKLPTLIYGYGGFSVSIAPFFKQSTILFIESGGVFAVPLIRGGGELGSNWHEQGRRLNKQNSFDDFICAADYLIDNKYSNPKKLAIMGGSNGGLLVGSVMVQQPEKFNVVIAKVGLFDMIRYQNFTIAPAWRGEYGVASDSLDFFNLIKYSPLHNIKKGVEYPATLLLTSNTDDRVPPLHSYKFAQALQSNDFGKQPKLLKVEESGGHSGKGGFENRMQIESLIFAFIMKNLGMRVF